MRRNVQVAHLWDLHYPLFEEFPSKTAGAVQSKFPWKRVGMVALGLGSGTWLGSKLTQNYVARNLPVILQQHFRDKMRELAPGIVLGGLLGAGVGAVANEGAPVTGLLLGGILGSALGGGLQYMRQYK